MTNVEEVVSEEKEISFEEMKKAVYSKKLNVIVMSNHKGGVTKTTSSFLISSLLSTDSNPKVPKEFKRKGTNTLAIDLDAQRNLTKSILGLEETSKIEKGVLDAISEGDALPFIKKSPNNEKLYVLPATKSISQFDNIYAKKLEDIEGIEKALEQSLIRAIYELEIENVVVDTAPASSILLKFGLNISLGSPTNVIVPFAVDLFGAESLEDISETIFGSENENIRLLGLLPVLINKTTSQFKKELKQVREIYADEIFDSAIYHRAGITNQTLYGFSEKSSKERKELEMYYSLLNEIKSRIV